MVPGKSATFGLPVTSFVTASVEPFPVCQRMRDNRSPAPFQGGVRRPEGLAMEARGQSAASLYAAALREGLAVFITAGGTQRDIARALNVAPATLSRYLKGERVAPREFLASLRDYLDQQGKPWTPEEYENLDALCGHAHAASGSPAVELAQLRKSWPACAANRNRRSRSPRSV